MEKAEPHVVVLDLTVAYGNNVILHHLTFTLKSGDISIIMGGSGGGKSTVLRSTVGLLQPVKRQVLYDGLSFWSAGPEEQKIIMKKFGILYQDGALWSSLTLGKNVAVPIKEYNLRPAQIKEIVSLKLALVGLAGFEEYYPSEISGGMKKRAGLARAMALDPDILFFDEPSAVLDPIRAHLLDELIIKLRNSLGATVVVVTHELASIFAIGNNSVFLDVDTKTMIAGRAQKTPHRVRGSQSDQFSDQGREPCTGSDEVGIDNRGEKE
jgi:phospholipid/cholesterol/gamma-HCH transport system ATP-binding protein